MDSENIMFYVAVTLLVLIIISYLLDQFSKNDEEFDDEEDNIQELKGDDNKEVVEKEVTFEDEDEVIDLEPEPVSNQVLPAINEEEYAPVELQSSLLTDEKPKKRGGKKSQKP